MFPVAFTIGKIPVSSFGVSLALGLLAGVFLIWRLIRAWDLDEEKILDLTLLTFFGGLIGARFYFVFSNLGLFSNDIFSFFYINKVPGFSFWGAIIVGFSTLYFFSKKRKMDFWILSDIASIGFITSLIFVNFGCFLGGCNVGVPSKLFLAVNMVGEVGRRFPVQLLEATLLLMGLSKLWSLSIHFHQRGKILSLTLIYLGVINILTFPLKAYDQNFGLSLGLIILGIYVFYKVTKRNIKTDAKIALLFLKNFFSDSQSRKHTLSRVGKYWYNQKTQVSWNFRNLKKGLKKLNVRFSYKNN